MRSTHRITLVALGLVAAACSPGSGASPSAVVSSSAPPSTGVVVTFQVAAEQYRIELTDPADIEIARKLLAGEEAPRIPNGVVVRGDPGVNTGYSWHIDPDNIEFADVTTEVCDGLPSDVEANEITSDRFCPWEAKVVGIEE